MLSNRRVISVTPLSRRSELTGVPYLPLRHARALLSLSVSHINLFLGSAGKESDRHTGESGPDALNAHQPEVRYGNDGGVCGWRTVLI